MKRAVLAIALSLPFLTGCPGSAPATANTPASPKQSLDQQMAAWLYTAQTTIESMTPMLDTNPGLHDPLNKIRASYTTLKNGYLLYHASITQGGTPDATSLSMQIQQLVASAQALVALYKP